MAAEYVSDVEGADEGGVTLTLTLASVLGGGGNLVLAFFTWRRNASQDTTGVTFGGSAMTQLGAEVDFGGGTAECWYYLSPAGTGNVVATWGAAPASIQGTAMVISGADVAGTPFGTRVSSSGSVAAISNSVTLESGGLAADVLFVRSSAPSLAPDAGQTERSAQEAADSMFHRTSTEAGVNPTLGWTWTGASSAGHIVVPVNAAPSGPVNDAKIIFAAA